MNFKRCFKRCRGIHAARAAGMVAVLCSSLLPSSLDSLRAQNLPNLGDESATVLSPQMERKIGEGFYRELRRDPSFLDDPEATAYVRDLGYRLIAAGPDPRMDVEFFLIKDTQINAFAMLGGFIGINTGLLLAAQSESEAASVMGHELGHLTQKHIARGVSAGQRSSAVSMLAMVACILAARSNPQVGGGCLMGAQAAQVQSQLAYSRDFEREADRVGFDVLQRGGFDVSAMPVFFERLQRSTRLLESSAPAYVRSHPLTTERIADVQNRVRTVPYRQHVPDPAFELVRAKLRATMDGSVDGMRTAVRFFEGQIENRTYTNPQAAYLGLAYAQLQANNPKAADLAYQRLPKQPAHAMFDTLAARIRVAQGDVEGALRIMRAAAQRYSQLRHMQVGYIEALQAANRHQDALALLREPSQTYRSDAKLFQLQAVSYGATGQKMSEHQARAEYLVLLGQPRQAIEELQAARCSGDGDFYQQSIIDARMRVLWDEILSERAEQQKGGQPATGADPRKGLPGVEQRLPSRC